MGVRAKEGESYRIYLPGSTFPGLTMSRAFGDVVLARKGVIQEPVYKCVLMQPADEWYAVLASDGLWEFLEFDQVLSLSSKKLRLKGPMRTVEFLRDASQKRWAHYCGDYCDDITIMCVQWNA